MVTAPPTPVRRVLVGRAGAPGSGVGAVLRVEPAVGRDVVRRGPDPDAAPPGSPDPDLEAQRLRAALDQAHLELAALATATAERAGSDVGAIFEAQALFARDPGLVEPALAAVAAGSTAAAAIEETGARMAGSLAAVDDDYIRERAADVRDVARRVVAILTGQSGAEVHHRDGRRAVLVGDDLDPSVVAGLRTGLVAGLALAGGAPNGHTAIVARALGIPLVLGLGAAALDLAAGATALVDGDRGRVIVTPEPDDLVALPREPVAASAEAPADATEAAGSEVAPLPVLVAANIGSVREAEEAARLGVDGIGLVRTELLFLGRSVAPGLDEQAALYRRMLAALPDRPVVFRTLDIGGDKPSSYAGSTHEANPALGVRGIRLGLRTPHLLETQLRALLEAAAGHTLHLLLPMISVVDELEDIREALDRARQASRAAGREHARKVHLGVMIEVPSAALLADAFAARVDFFSIGTNDLVQYTLAADRTNPALADLASPLQPAVLRLIARVCAAASAWQRPVTVCGEAAGDPNVAPLFVGLGVNELSVGPSAVPRTRAALTGLDVDHWRGVAEAALAASTMAEVRRLLDDAAGARFNPAADPAAR